MASRALLLTAFTLVATDSARAQDGPKVEVVAQLGHSDGVTSVAFSSDGRAVLSGSRDKTLKLWEAATGRLMRTFEGNSEAVTSVAFSPDGRSVLSGSEGWKREEKTLRLWDAATGRLVRVFEGASGGVGSVAFSPDGRSVASGGLGAGRATLKLWDAATGRLVHNFGGYSEAVMSVAFSPDGGAVIAGGSAFAGAAAIGLWNAATGQRVRPFNKHSNDVRSVAFSPDGRSAVSGSWGPIELWDVATGRLVRTFEKHSGPVGSIAFSADGRHVTSADGQLVKLWNPANGRLVRAFGEDPAFGENPTSVAFSPDGRSVLSGSMGGKLRLWEVATGRLLQTFEGYLEPTQSVALSPDGGSVIWGGPRTTSKLWDAANGRPLRTFEGHSQAVLSVAFSPDGRRVISGGWDNAINLWDAATGGLVRTVYGSGDSVAFSSDGRSMISAGTGPIQLWDMRTGEPVRRFGERGGGWLKSVAFSPDGCCIASGELWGDRITTTVKVWDATRGTLMRAFEGHSASTYSVAFSPDGRRVISGGSSAQEQNLKLWDTASGKPVRTFKGHSGEVRSVAFTQDGRSILSGGADQTLKLWDAATGKLIRTFAGHSGMVTSLAVSSDGRKMVSASTDATVRFWWIADGREVVRQLAGRGGDWVAMTPTGFFDAGGGADKSVHLVRGMEVLSIRQVHQSLFNPDLVREALSGDPSGEVADAATVVNLERVVSSGPAPGVTISSPADGSQSAVDLVTITARIENRGKGVGRIEWRVNGITVAVAAKPSGGGPVYTVTKDLALDPGDNTIEVTAYNGSNLLASLPARTTVKFTGPADKTKPRLHILAIGIDKYVDEKFAPPLDFAEKDAKVFAESMKKAAAGLYDQVLPPTLVLGKDGTRANLERVMRRIAGNIHPRDTFILFASGHGTSSHGRFYLIPQDYRSGSASLSDGAIGQDQLQNWLANRIRARKAVILLDTCQSGALVAGHRRSRIDAPASEVAVGRLHEATGRPVLTAAAAGKDAIEGIVDATGERHGIFTWAVIEALRKGDTNGNGLIELSELVSHVQSAVPRIAAGTGDEQAARFGSRGEDFVVARRLQ
jgi:WD40 repeat protein